MVRTAVSANDEWNESPRYGRSCGRRLIRSVVWQQCFDRMVLSSHPVMESMCSACYNHNLKFVHTFLHVAPNSNNSVCTRKMAEWYDSVEHHRSAAKTRKIESILTFLPHTPIYDSHKKSLPEMRKPVTIMTPMFSFQFNSRHLLLLLHIVSYSKEAEEILIAIYDLIAFHLVIARGHDHMLAPASMEAHSIFFIISIVINMLAIFRCGIFTQMLYHHFDFILCAKFIDRWRINGWTASPQCHSAEEIATLMVRIFEFIYLLNRLETRKENAKS